MTRQLMNLADGKVVLVLEGGYELNALAECGRLCIEALLGRQVHFEIIDFNFWIFFVYLDSNI
jgi:acetoin utilization deacetylase AcuC-like enzyme